MLKLNANIIKPYEIRITNLLGQVVSQRQNILPGEKTITFDLAGYPAGIYVVNIQASNKAYSLRLIKN